MSDQKERKKNKWSGRNLIISIAAAIAVWVSVVYTINPDISVTVTPSKIRIIGEQELRNRGMVWADKSKLPEFPIKISGKRSDLIDALDQIKVELDVSEVTFEGEGTITPVITIPNNITLEKQRFGDLEITTERVQEKNIPVKIRQMGTLKDQLLRSEPQTEQIRITGAKNQVDNIASCMITVDAALIEGDEEKEYVYMFADSENNLVSVYDTIEAEKSKILVKNTFYRKLTLPVEIENDGELMKHFMINIRSVIPETMEIGVRNGAEPQSVKAVFENGEYVDGVGEYGLTAEEPENCYIPKRDVRIRAELTKKARETAQITVYPKNLQEGLTAVGMPMQMSAEVIGPEDQLKDITASVDLAGLGAGTHEVEVMLDHKDITPANPIRINVMIE